ncbi:MAG: nucleotidyltransferase domain-containing protein [Chloroflexi bacterium]|nr:nucleotidyltransferase domain-containing protein [Chloroflexota bacterium]
MRKDMIPALERLKKILAADPRILAAFLYGSQVEGCAMPHSDVDVAVLFTAEAAPTITGRDVARLEAKLIEATGLPVEVVHLNRASLLLQHRAISGISLFERDPIAVSDFIEGVLKARRATAYRRNRRLQEFFGTASRD